MGFFDRRGERNDDPEGDYVDHLFGVSKHKSWSPSTRDDKCDKCNGTGRTMLGTCHPCRGTGRK